MRFNVIFQGALGIGLLAVSFLFASHVVDERFWYANRALVTIFDHSETIEDFRAVKLLDKKLIEMQKQQEEYYKNYKLNEVNIKKLEKEIEKLNEKESGFKNAMGALLPCLLEQNSVPILVSEEIFSVVLTGEPTLADVVFKKWYCFDVNKGVYLLIPQNDRCLGEWKPSQKLNEKDLVTDNELRIGFRLDNLTLLNKESLGKKLAGKAPSNNDLENQKKQFTKEEGIQIFEKSQSFSKRQLNAICGKNGQSPLFVTRADRKNVSEDSYPEKSWVIVMQGHGSTYHYKNQKLIDHYNKQIVKLMKNIDEFNKQAKLYAGYIDNYKKEIADINKEVKKHTGSMVTVEGSVKPFPIEKWGENEVEKLKSAIAEVAKTITEIQGSVAEMKIKMKEMEFYRDTDSQAHAGIMVGIDAKDLVMIWDFFDTRMVVRLVFIDPCYGGGANAPLALKDLGSGGQKKYTFTIGFGTSTEVQSFSQTITNTTGMVCLNANYKTFLAKMFSRSTVEKPVDIVEALQSIHSFYTGGSELAVGNVVLIKPAGGEWVQAIRLEKKIASFGRILAQSCDPKKELNIRTFFSGQQNSKDVVMGPEVIALFAEYIPCPLLCDTNLPTFVSEVTGPAVHIFESIRAPISSPEDAVKSFLSLESLAEDKLFWVKKTELSGKTYEAFFSNSLKNYVRTALFVEKIKDKVVAVFQLKFSEKQIIKTQTPIKDLAQTKRWYEDKIQTITGTEKIAQLGLIKKDLMPDEVKKLQDIAAYSDILPRKVLKNQALYTQQLFSDFAYALSGVA